MGCTNYINMSSFYAQKTNKTSIAFFTILFDISLYQVQQYI